MPCTVCLQGEAPTTRTSTKPCVVKAELLPCPNKLGAAAVLLDRAKPVQLVAFGDINDTPIIRVHVCNPGGGAVEHWSTARPDAPE
jgi:hypothetical protein